MSLLLAPLLPCNVNIRQTIRLLDLLRRSCCCTVTPDWSLFFIVTTCLMLIMSNTDYVPHFLLLRYPYISMYYFQCILYLFEYNNICNCSICTFNTVSTITFTVAFVVGLHHYCQFYHYTLLYVVLI